MVENLYRSGLIDSIRVKEALLNTDRAFYAPTSPYADSPQLIGFGQTISAPHMHAHALETLSKNIGPGSTVLDVGCGSGYLSAALARMVKPGGKVYGIDIVPGLVYLSNENANKDEPHMLSSGELSFLVADGWAGLPEKAPFDAIHVGAAAEQLPEKLMQQLKVGGRMVVPLGPDGGIQELAVIERVGPTTGLEAFKVHAQMGVRYVPLIHGHSEKHDPNNANIAFESLDPSRCGSP